MNAKQLIGSAAAFLLVVVIASLAGIGAVALACADVTLLPKSSSDVAAWVQAAAAAVAIVASAWLALHIQHREQRAARKQSAEVAMQIAVYARNLLRIIRDRLSTRELLDRVATGQTPFDRSALDDLWSMLSAISLQELRDAAITKELMILRGTVRQYRLNVDLAIANHGQMSAGEYTIFINALTDAAAGAATVYTRVSEAASQL